MSSKEIKKVPRRDEVDPADCWDLSRLFPNDPSWEAAFTKWEKRIEQYSHFQGTLGRLGRKVWPPA